MDYFSTVGGQRAIETIASSLNTISECMEKLIEHNNCLAEQNAELIKALKQKEK